MVCDVMSEYFDAVEIGAAAEDYIQNRFTTLCNH